MPLFSILHSTARPQSWRAAPDAWISSAIEPSRVEYVLCVDERWGFPARGTPLSDFAGAGRNGLNHLVWNEGRRCYVDGVNTAARASTGQILIVIADDQFPCPQWDLRLMEVLTRPEQQTPNPLTDPFAMHVSTGYCDGPMASGMQILSRARFEQFGYVLYPGYESLYADDDFLWHAYEDGIVIHARHLLFPHRHAEPNEWDAVYHHQNREQARVVGCELFERRKASKFQEAA